jgi:hypothetical protein
MSKKIVVYTCITGNYDKLLRINETSNDIDFICFTDSYKKTNNFWKIYPLQSPMGIKDGCYINRFHKIFSKNFLWKYRYSIYIDGNIEYKYSYKNLAEKFIATKCAMGAFHHPDGRNLYDEAEACIKFKKFGEYDLRRYGDQLLYYKRSGYDLSKKISANYLIIKDHHFFIDKAMSQWWSHLFEYTKRDQMSFNYILWKEKIPFVYLDEIDHKSIHRHHHKVNFIKMSIILLAKKYKKIKQLL